jgi:YD repeat-containing protein
MAITVSTLYAGTITLSGGTANQSITVASGAEMLTVCVLTPTAGAITSMSYNGSGLTSRVTVNDSNSRTAAIYDLANPTAGTINLVVNGGNVTSVIVVRSLVGIDTGTPRGTAQSYGAFGGNRTLTLTTVSGDVGIDIIGNVNTLTTTDSRATQYNGVNAVGTTDVASSEKVASGTSTVMNWTHTSDWTAFVAIPYKVAGGGGASNAPRSQFYHLQGMR